MASTDDPATRADPHPAEEAGTAVAPAGHVPPAPAASTAEAVLPFADERTTAPTGGKRPLGRTPAAGRAFRQLLVNALLTSITGSFLWFALTFWVYLRTRSVVATGVIGGAYSISSALTGPAFGTFVDRHRKHTSLLVPVWVSASLFAVAATIILTVPPDSLLRLRSPFFWILVASTLLGAVASFLRGIVLSTCVTLLVVDDQRDRANGMVGTVTGLSFALTSVFSGLVIGTLGMRWAYVIALALTIAAGVHMWTIRFDEPDPEPTPPGERTPAIDVRGALEAIRAVPGLGLLIGLAAFNNLLAGVFMALIDAYGLELVSVEVWGFMWTGICTAFIAAGIGVAKWGLGSSPVRLILAGNLLNWVVCAVFTLGANLVVITAALFVWMGLIPIIEAAEQTVLQKAIPYQRQGRVFGFAQLVENAASPLTAFLIAPLAEVVFIPFMLDGSGANALDGWFGNGPAQGMGLMFTLAGLAGIVVTSLAWGSPAYRRLRRALA